MTKTIDITIWGREYSLPVIYDCYEGEDVTPEQISALESFVSHSNWIDRSKKNVENFCKQDVQADDTNQKKDNIFSYIKPESLYVKRDSKNPRVALMCKYRYDPEHGLAVVFAADGTVTVGIQDIIL